MVATTGVTNHQRVTEGFQILTVVLDPVVRDRKCSAEYDSAWVSPRTAAARNHEADLGVAAGYAGISRNQAYEGGECAGRWSVLTLENKILHVII